MKKILLFVLIPFFFYGCIRHYDQELTHKKRTSVEEKNKLLSKLSVNLMVNDVNQTIDFYKSIVGFEELITIPDEGTYNYAVLEKDGYELILEQKESLQEDIEYFKNIPVGGSFALYLEVKDILIIYEKAILKAEIIRELHQTAHATKEFSIKDNNGYILTFAEKLK